MCFSERENDRYSRQMVMPQIGAVGQQKLKAAKALIIGTGGLGSPVAYYLASVGVGTLSLVDSDNVELSNLNRQILHSQETLGVPKVASAAARLRQLNPDIQIIEHQQRVGADNVTELVEPYDLVIDAVDSLETRFVVNDGCVRAGKPLIEAGVIQFSGMVMTIIPGKSACYRCVFPELPPAGSLATPSQLGVVGAMAGVIGCLQAVEAIKFIIGQGNVLADRILWVDGLNMTFEQVAIKRERECPGCGGV